MNKNYRKFAPVGLYLSLIAAAVSLGLYIVQRTVDLPLQISLGIILLGLAIAILLDPQRAKEVFTGRQAKNTSNTFFMGIAVLGILVIINYLVYNNSKRWDLTEGKQNSLAPETIEILSRLPSKVNVTGYFTARYSKETATQLLENYKAAANGNFDYKFIDPDADPVAAQAAKITRDGTLVVSLDGRSEQLTYADETELSGALIRLANPGKRNIYFLTGHGEYEPEGSDNVNYGYVKSSLVAKNYTVNTLNLLQDPNIPDDALAVIIAAGKTSLSEKEVILLKEYLNKGKAVVWLVNPGVESGIKAAEDIFSAYIKTDWSITVEDDLMIDTKVDPPSVLVADQYADHPITDKLKGLVTIFPIARSITFDPNATGFTFTKLVSSSNASWGETDMTSISNQKVSPDSAADHIGPVEVALAAQNTTTNGRLVVFGDAEFSNDEYIAQYGQFGNGTLLINAIDWAAGQENLINLTSKETVTRVLTPPTIFTNGMILLITVFIIPGAVLLAGIITWVQRKKRG